MEITCRVLSEISVSVHVWVLYWCWLGSPLHIESSLPCVLWLSPDPEDCEKALPGEAACTLDESLQGTLHRQVPKHTDCQTPVIHAEPFFKAQKIFLHTATLTKVCDVVCSCVWRSSMWLSVLTVIFFLLCFPLFLCFPFPPLLSLSPLSLSQSSSAAISPQLTKLHQLAMQQSPFPIAPSNQGFTGTQHDMSHRLSMQHFINSFAEEHDWFAGLLVVLLLQMFEENK